MKILGLVLGSVVLFSLAACVFSVDDDGTSHVFWSSAVRGSGVEASQTRDVPAFTRIEARGSTEIDIKVGEPQSVVVRTDDNLIANLTTEVKDGALVVSWHSDDHKSFSTRAKTRVEIVVPSLTGLSLSGSGNVELANMSGESLSIEVQGSGDIRASGKVDRLTASISGSGDLKLFDLDVREAHVSIAGSGDVSLTARESLEASVAGSGDVRYRGSPKMTRRIAGSGSVQPD